MKLGKLLQPLHDATVINYAERSIHGLALDSRKVRRSWLFAVVPGPRHDGTAYVPDAIANGAAAILSSVEVFVPQDVTLIVVPDVRQALATQGRGLAHTSVITTLQKMVHKRQLKQLDPVEGNLPVGIKAAPLCTCRHEGHR